MSILRRKSIREAWAMKAQVLAIVALVATGVLAFITSVTLYRSLRISQDDYYTTYRFADVFGGCTRAPEGLQDRIAEIEGVAAVHTRVVEMVRLNLPDFDEPVRGQIVSIPPLQRSTLNDIHLRSGRYVDQYRDDEILLSEAFAVAHNLREGAKVSALLNGTYKELSVVGIAISPEHVYQLPPGQLFPDDKRFALMWMQRDAVASAFDMEGAFNDVSLSVQAGARELDVIDRLDDLLEPYGGFGAYTREDQLSHRTIDQEMESLRAQGIVMPLIFLGVAAFLLSVVLSRMIQQQRGIIATMRAFGLSKVGVAAHYTGLAVIVVVVGSIIGTALGVYFGKLVLGVYADYFRFPELIYRLEPWVYASAFALSLFMAMLGVIRSAWRAASLPPAEGMRSEPPAQYRRTLIERTGLAKRMPVPWRIVVRHLERKPLRGLLTSLGIAFSVALLVVGNFFVDTLDYLMDVSFNSAMRQDLNVTFYETTSSSALHELASIEGVEEVEPFRSVSCEISKGHREERTGIQGFVVDAQLNRIVDRDGLAVSVPPEGLLLSSALAKQLDAQVGDLLRVEVKQGKRPTRDIAVVGIVDDLMGASAYMSFDALNRVMREDGAMSGAYLRIDADKRDLVYERLHHSPMVSSVVDGQAGQISFEETTAENMLVMRMMQIIFACIIALAVVYNSARITLSERSRELGSLRVLGMTKAEIARILLGELAILTLIALPIGCVIGTGFAHAIAKAVESDLYRFPVVIYTKTYIFACSVVLIASLLTALVVRRRVYRLDMIAVLKERE